MWSLWMFKDGTNGGGPLDFLTPPQPVPRKNRFQPWQPDRWTRQKQKQKKNPPGEKSGGSLGCPVPGNAIQIRDVNWILQIS